MGEAARVTSEDIVRINLDAGQATPARARAVNETATSEASPAKISTIAPAPAGKTQRVASVDALRGFTIFMIIGGDGMAWSLQQMLAGKDPFVSAAGKFIGHQFSHVPWDGFLFYDLVFPLFIFTTGISIVLSLTRLVEREGKAKAHLRVLQRSLLLFALGILFYGGLSHKWPEIRLLGVLQRIALCYLFASLLFLNFRLRDLAIVFAAILIGYWALMTFVPVPGIGAGSYAEEANLANWIDLHYLPGRKWNGTWDPEGLLSTLPAIGTALMGVFAGMLLMNPRVTSTQKSMWLIASGALTVLAGYLWGLQFPVIKSIWTSSFVLVAGGYSLLLLGVMHQLVDVWGWRKWSTIFVWIGANAITLYFLNNVASFERFATRLVGGDVGLFLDRALTPGTGRFVAHAVGLAIAVAIAGFLYRRKIFLRV